MKRYIRASISEGTPDWLRKELTRGRWNGFKQKFLDKCHVALDKAEYTDTPVGNAQPIYLLATDYGTEVYSPGVNDDETAIINGRQRKLGSIAKSKLPEMAVEIAYIDLHGDNVAPIKDRYRDPRRTYRYDKQGQYAGQYKKTRYDRETGEDLPDGWSDRGMTPSNESRARDKSGYKIPSPEERLEQYYTRYPEKITSKVDALYDKLIQTRQLLMDTDFNTPVRDYWDNGPDVDYGKAYRRFADAVDDYRRVLTELKADSVNNRYGISRFARTISDISSRVDDIQRILNGERL